MTKRPAALTGTAGVYYVAYQLAARTFHAAVTHGNAPTVDILVALLDGAATLSLQVKTSSWARRTPKTKRAKRPDHYEWDIGQRSATLCRPDLFFALVDLKSRSGQPPDVFIIPSEVIFAAFNRPYFKSGKPRRWMYHPKAEEIECFKNDWDRLRTYLQEKSQTTKTDNSDSIGGGQDVG